MHGGLCTQPAMTDVATGADRRLELPFRFGSSYLLFDRVGSGGMAEIYLARGKTRVGATRLAVVKVVLPALAGDSRFADMLIAEAKLAAQLSHANVVQTYDLGREAGQLYIAMEYVEGFDLNELLRRCTKAKLPLPAEFVLHIVSETLSALDYAHRRKDPNGQPLGIVHRDVSPSNVLISFEGEVKLCDFGIARAVTALGGSSNETIEGKAGYMSPEHARGEAIDARSDVFAAAIVLWELLAGRRLYKSQPGREAIAQAREADIPPLPDRGLPDHARLSSIVMRGLERDPAKRYPSALAMARDLDAYVSANHLVTSPLRLGTFLTEHFGAEIIEQRRARERAAAAIEAGPLLKIEVVSFPKAPPPTVDEPLPVAPSPDPQPFEAAVTAIHDSPPVYSPTATASPAKKTAIVAPPSRGMPFGMRVTLAGLAIAVAAGSFGWLMAHR